MNLSYNFDFICDVCCIFPSRFFSRCLGEQPEAIQRGCANANIDMSIVFYIVTVSMVLQQLNRITHGYGVPYDMIRWLKSITPNTIACEQHQYENLSDNFSFNASNHHIGMEEIRLSSTSASRLSSTVSWEMKTTITTPNKQWQMIFAGQ